MGMMATYRLENSGRKGERTSPPVSRPTCLKNCIWRMDALYPQPVLASLLFLYRKEWPSYYCSLIVHIVDSSTREYLSIVGSVNSLFQASFDEWILEETARNN